MFPNGLESVSVNPYILHNNYDSEANHLSAVLLSSLVKDQGALRRLELKDHMGKILSTSLLTNLDGIQVNVEQLRNFRGCKRKRTIYVKKCDFFLFIYIVTVFF